MSRWAGLIGENKRQVFIKKGAELHAVLVIYKQVLLRRVNKLKRNNFLLLYTANKWLFVITRPCASKVW